eukprot:COSAG01_NODE_31299_length_600_cov_0.822355_2_plen_37_part_01
MPSKKIVNKKIPFQKKPNKLISKIVRRSKQKTENPLG